MLNRVQEIVPPETGLMTPGLLLSIERGSIDDGPGLRTVAFLKGCPLRCLWCSTPDAELASSEMEYFIDRCIACKKCAEACPTGAILVSDGEILTDRTGCDNCGKCVEVCPGGARKMAGKKTTVMEVLGEVRRDSVFYQYSGGGVTLSGGEPLLQPEFSIELLKACQREGIHTAIETCAHADWHILRAALKYTDLAHVDIKHMDPAQHKRLTGRGNSLILSNIRRACHAFPNVLFIIRVPVIPGYNDSDQNIADTARFASELPNIQRIELLPYHRLGTARYSALGREYPLEGVPPPSEDHLNHLKKLAGCHGLAVQIGGR
ncbi:MAG: glycyl-radical enzyme activating protein [Chloroflexi bacterium]|nr:glycyl-radical enzyme activating protein [Chloroflexota bacterium]